MMAALALLYETLVFDFIIRMNSDFTAKFHLIILNVNIRAKGLFNNNEVLYLHLGLLFSV